MANLNIRAEDTLKKQAETVFSGLGISLSTATTILDVPNAETLSAIDEVNHGNNLSKSFPSVAELMEDLT